jgi:glycosyltransferase involved in cell wall biosynthesis
MPAPEVKIRFAAPGINPSLLQLALSLYEANLLGKFSTTLAFGAGHWLPRRIPKLASRELSALPADSVSTWPWLELLRLACIRLDRSGRLADRIWELADHRFARREAMRLQDCDALIGIEHACLESFEHAGTIGVKRVYEVPSAHSALASKLLEREYTRWPELRPTSLPSNDSPAAARRQKRRDREFELADIVLAHSSFTRASYIDAGFPGDKIHVVPFGAPPVNVFASEALARSEHRRADRPTFLFAGNFAAHKGAHVLLEAWRLLKEPGARLLVAGDLYLPDAAMRGCPEGIEFLGRLPWSELQRLYARCTALVFPSLSDGFGMVVTEAFANGLPVITTPNAGAADLLVHGSNGLLVPILDPVALADAMRQLLDDDALALAMRHNAIRTARDWQWSDFRASTARLLKEKLA